MQEEPNVVTPLRLFICKVASRCNLDCDYCYVYKHADQSWRDQPRFMTPETTRMVGERIRRHCEAHGLNAIDVVMHGGEPLLAGLDYLDQWCQVICEQTANIKVRFRMQSNGVLFDNKAAEFCLRWNITVGLSCDGGGNASDRHRLDFAGQSSFPKVQQALEILAGPARSVWSGFLTVIDIENDPLEVYSFLRSYNPRSIEFLLPLGHYEMPPKGKEADLKFTPYADWLIPIFDAWFREVPNNITIRRFRDIIALMAGAQNSTEEWGLQPVDFAVVETNGAIEAVDTLKTTYPGANRLQLNVLDNDFDEMSSRWQIRDRTTGLQGLCNTCQECEFVRVCGGGYYPHRYSRRNGFQNPSVYCSDLIKLMFHAHSAALSQIADAALKVRMP